MATSGEIPWPPAVRTRWPLTNGFGIGPLSFHAYGIAYVFAVAAAIAISRWGWRRRGGNPDLVYEVATWGFPAGLVGGRIYFDARLPARCRTTGGECSRSGRVGWGSAAGSPPAPRQVCGY